MQSRKRGQRSWQSSKSELVLPMLGGRSLELRLVLLELRIICLISGMIYVAQGSTYVLLDISFREFFCACFSSWLHEHKESSCGKKLSNVYLQGNKIA